MKKALVTGAAGFIGSHVVRDLLEENVEVRALVLPGESTASIDGLDVEIQTGDILDPAAASRAVSGVDTVFHLAAIYKIWMKEWRAIYEVNLQGSRNILWSCLRHGVQKVVYTSSIAAIGTRPGNEASNEETPFNQYDLGNHYILTKYLSQQEALGFAKNGLDLVSVNPAFPFGENDRAPTPTGQIIVNILSGKVPFYFPGGFNVIDVRDISRGHLLAARKGRTGETYILANRNIRTDEFIYLVKDLAGFPRRQLIRLPVLVAQGVTAGMKWWADTISGRPPLSSPVEIKYSSQCLFFDNTKARRELGLEPRPIEESLKTSIEWFRANGYVTSLFRKTGLPGYSERA